MISDCQLEKHVLQMFSARFDWAESYVEKMVGMLRQAVPLSV